MTPPPNTLPLEERLQNLRAFLGGNANGPNQAQTNGSSPEGMEQMALGVLVIQPKSFLQH